MKLTFLGTGTSMGVPVIGCQCEVCRSADRRDSRLRTSALLQIGGAQGRNILFDIGPDFRQQMLACGATHLDAVLITHAHRDHVAGMDDVRPINYQQGGPVSFFLNAEARHAIERDYHYIFAPHRYPGLPEVKLHTVGDAPFQAAGHEVLPVHAMHKDLPVLGYRIGPMAYITDANYIAPAELDKLRGLEVLVINALRKEHHFSHFSLPEALAVVEQVAPRRAYFTHISHEMGFHEAVCAELPAGVALAYDNLTIEI